MSDPATDGRAFVASVELAGATQMVLGVVHVVLWRRLGWTREIASLSPLTARVFAVHTFFVAFVLVLLGALGLFRADLLAAPSPLARLISGGAAIFWLLRLLAQPLVFDPVLLPGSRWRLPVRLAATTYLALATLVYAWGFARQPS